MVWVLIIALGLAAEITTIIALGLSTTGNYEAELLRASDPRATERSSLAAAGTYEASWRVPRLTA